MYIPPRFVIEDDDLDLLWRFTAYMELVVRHARIDYLRRQNKFRQNEVSMDQADIDEIASYDISVPLNNSGFDFENKKLGDEFTKLNDLRKKILTLIFVDRLSTEEIVDTLKCSADDVYMQKYKALKKLRDQLIEEGGGYGK